MSTTLPRCPERVETRLVGLSFTEGHPANILRLVELWENGEPIAARLQRVPGNEFDPNAIAVVCVAAGGRIGWVPRGWAARIAPRIDAGRRWFVTIHGVRVHPDHPDNPGIDLLLEEEF